MYNSYNELLYDCTNRIQIYVSDSNVENAEKEQIIAAFSNELTKFLIGVHLIGSSLTGIIRINAKARTIMVPYSISLFITQPIE